jgi:hypothetical protein
MPYFLCGYVADGVHRTARIKAVSAEAAAAKMRDLPWNDSSGPVGAPTPEVAQWSVPAPVWVALFVAAAASAPFYRHLDHEFRKAEMALSFSGRHDPAARHVQSAPFRAA